MIKTMSPNQAFVQMEALQQKESPPTSEVDIKRRQSRGIERKSVLPFLQGARMEKVLRQWIFKADFSAFTLMLSMMVPQVQDQVKCSPEEKSGSSW